jgi:hypothetical protein
VVLDGLFVRGGDIVLRGDFECVRITCCTLDPGTAVAEAEAGSPPAVFATAADGRPLAATRLWIEGGIIGKLLVDRSILGPVRCRAGGKVEQFEAADAIIQAVPRGDEEMGSPPELSPPGDADLALDFSDGEAALSRCTVMGPIRVHRLRVSESILNGIAAVDDLQNGCVRFTAWTEGSQLPRKYESVPIRREASLFVSTEFGQPGYAQLLPVADFAVVPSSAGGTSILQGAENGSEMGAFARERNSIKERSLLIKLDEFMPAGLIPVIVHVT